MLVVFLFLLFDPFGKERRHRFLGMTSFTVILLAGLVGAPGNEARDVAKDLWYVGNAAMSLWLAYLIASKLDDIQSLLRVIIAAAAVVSFFHLCRFALDPAIISQSVIDIRTEVGVGYLLSALGIGVLLADYRFRLDLLPNRLAWWFFMGICLASVALSFSRTLWIGVFTFVFVLIAVAYFKQTLRIAVVAGVALIAVMASPLLDDTTEPDTNSTFAEKAINSLRELRVSDYEDTLDIHRNWRGFESYRALETFAEGNLCSYLFGKGFGTSVDLGVTMLLMEEEFDSIPVLHNGYLYLLVKTGCIGMAAYLSYLLLSLRLGAKLLRLQPQKARGCGCLIIALALFMLESTLVISGMFNKGWVFPATLFLGMLMGHAESMLQGTGPQVNVHNP